MVLVDTTTNEVLPLPIASMTEKCVWSNDDSVIYCGVPVDLPSGATYPDDWYQGAVHFSDRIWKIQVSYLRTTRARFYERNRILT